MDCAHGDTALYYSEIDSCDSLVLKGPGSTNYRILSYLVVVPIKGSIREIHYFGNKLPLSALDNFQELKAGDSKGVRKIFIEKVVVISDKKVRSELTKSFKFYILKG
jgi:hypothetical protein